MRKLCRRIFANFQPRRNTLFYRRFRRPNERVRSRRIIVFFQIDRTDKSDPPLYVRRAANSEDKPFRRFRIKIAIQIFFYGFVNSALCALFGQINFRQDNFQGRRFIAHIFGEFFPILRFGSKLIAGNDCPCRQIRPLAGKQKFCRL